MRTFVAFIAGVLSIVSLASCSSSYSPSERYHTVTFNSDGGTNISSQKVKHGEKASKPEDPLKDQYIFDYWEYNQEKWFFAGYVVTEDITLLAKYNESLLNCPAEQTVYIDDDTNFTINVSCTPSNQTITAKSLDESIVVVKEITILDENNFAIKFEAKKIGEVDVAIETNYKTTKTCHISIVKRYLDVELYDIVKTHYASISDPSIENVYLNKKVHFFATVSGYSEYNSDYNLFLQRYNEKENKYYGIMLYLGGRVIPNKYRERGALLEIYGMVSQYNGVCRIIEPSYFPTTSSYASGDCKVIKTVTENIDPLTKLKVLEYSASEFNITYLSNDITIFNLPIKINDALQIKTIESVVIGHPANSIYHYHFYNYDFSLYAKTIEDAEVGDYIKINYAVFSPNDRLLNSTFNTSEDIVLLH